MARDNGFAVVVQITSGSDKASIRIPARGAVDEEAIGRAVKSYAQALADLRRNAKPRVPDTRPWWTK